VIREAFDVTDARGTLFGIEEDVTDDRVTKKSDIAGFESRRKSG
jgi:hypothetical protein